MDTLIAGRQIAGDNERERDRTNARATWLITSGDLRTAFPRAQCRSTGGSRVIRKALADERRGDEEGEGDRQRDPGGHEADEEWDRATRAEGRDDSEDDRKNESRDQPLARQLEARRPPALPCSIRFHSAALSVLLSYGPTVVEAHILLPRLPTRGTP